MATYAGWIKKICLVTISCDLYGLHWCQTFFLNGYDVAKLVVIDRQLREDNKVEPHHHHWIILQQLIAK